MGTFRRQRRSGLGRLGLGVGLAGVAILSGAGSPTTVDAAQAVLRPGSFSIGLGGGIAIIGMGDINNEIANLNAQDGTLFEEFSSGPELVGDFRYAISENAFFGIEGGYLSATAKDNSSGAELKAAAIPVALIGGFSTRPEGNVVFRFLGGIGGVFNGRFEDAVNDVSGAGFLAQIGGEFELRAVDSIGIALQGVARRAKVVRPDNSPLDLDFSGGSVRMMLRTYFGGKEE